ncbi:hypothetical protein PVK06_040068 [Gossypium arboreum]|uniref:Uncharacterized protein n=1 Tax=Gossypium arboreum TaxID=29729 RepID=A0ABR0N568_GOSAR|nr:hypothetical protein PVK06_040068 [Gossypium arboreum]
MDPLELPLGLITQARAKRFKDATTTLVNKVWGENIAGLLESSWTSKPSKPCTLLGTTISKLMVQLFKAPLRGLEWPKISCWLFFPKWPVSSPKLP